MDKILRPFGGTGAVCFPIGLPKDGGTCEFATEQCLKYCCAKGDFEYDEEIHISHEEKEVIHETFMATMPIDWILDEIVKELDGLQTTLLYWFGAGDCMTKDLKRICELIDKMPGGIVQMGFTRNVDLWKRYKRIFALTLDNEEDIGKREGLFALPDYKHTTTNLRLKTHQRSGYRGFSCSAVWVTEKGVDKKIKHYANCRTCYRLNFGCFDEDRNDLALRSRE